MRRMYSKEQLQKLIDEVSRLIAIEELDKVVPVPSLDKAGYYMQVNAAGTGYQLVPSPESTHLYYHPIAISSDTGEGENESRIQLVILDNNSTAYTKSTLITKLQNLMDLGAIINANGYVRVDNTLYPVYMFTKTTAYNVYYHTSSNRANLPLSNILGSSAQVQDGVNQLI